MCAYDFDYMVDPTKRPWDMAADPAVHGQCDCGRKPANFEAVTVWEEVTEDYFDRQCPSCWGEGRANPEDDGSANWVLRPVCARCDGSGEVYEPWNEPAKHRGVLCAHCTAASALLHEWCDGMYGFGDIPSQVTEHWEEDELYRSLSFGRLTILARSEWQRVDGLLQPVSRSWHDKAGHLVGVNTVERLVAEAIDSVAALEGAAA